MHLFQVVNVDFVEVEARSERIINKICNSSCYFGVIRAQWPEPFFADKHIKVLAD